MRRAAGVRRDVAVAGRGAGGRACAAARAGAARGSATQVTACRLHPSLCVACSARARPRPRQRAARRRAARPLAPPPAPPALAAAHPPARRPAPRRLRVAVARRVRTVSTHRTAQHRRPHRTAPPTRYLTYHSQPHPDLSPPP